MVTNAGIGELRKGAVLLKVEGIGDGSAAYSGLAVVAIDSLESRERQGNLSRIPRVQQRTYVTVGLPAGDAPGGRECGPAPRVLAAGAGRRSTSGYGFLRSGS